jgi:hypothetical protein
MTRFGQQRTWIAILPDGDGAELAVTDTARRFDKLDEIKNHCDPRQHRVITGISGADAWCQTLTLPSTDDDELAKMLQLQLPDLSPLPPEETVAGFLPLERTGASTRLLLAIAPKKISDERVAALDETGFDAEVVSIDSLALFRRLLRRNLLARDEHLNLFLRFEQRGIALIAHTNGTPLLVRFILAAPAATIAEEIRRTQFTLTLENRGHAAGEVVFAANPGNTLAEDLFRQCSGNLRRLDTADIPSNATALRDDAASDNASTFNLLSDDWRTRRHRVQLRGRVVRGSLVAAGVIALVLSVFCVSCVVQAMRLREFNAKIASVKMEYEAARQARASLTTLESQLDTQQTALEVLREVTELMPEKLRLTSFNFKKGQSLILRGETTAEAKTALDFIAKLDRCPLFLSAKMISMPTLPDGLTKFEVACTLKPVASAGGRMP